VFGASNLEFNLLFPSRVFRVSNVLFIFLSASRVFGASNVLFILLSASEKFGASCRGSAYPRSVKPSYHYQVVQLLDDQIVLYLPS